jgi:lipoyl(octanoyl) transferase
MHGGVDSVSAMAQHQTLEVIRHERQAYPDSLAEQEKLVAERLAGARGDTIVFTEHPPVYTLGTSASDADVLTREIDGEVIEVFPAGRGGEVT